MYLCRLIYASYANREFSGPELDELLLVSRHNNARASLTGVLFTHGRHFFQVLEGERTRVNELYHRIARDPRCGFRAPGRRLPRSAGQGLRADDGSRSGPQIADQGC